ncbi:MAG: hypothetical protein M3Q45_14680 [Chloroflexota bacterium]|nr:hypothetical protein [Chloroflexota bacterium]
MVQKVFKTGDRMAIALPQALTDILELGEGSEVSIELDQTQRHIVIAPLKTVADGVDAAFAKQVADFIQAYRPALEALAQ